MWAGRCRYEWDLSGTHASAQLPANIAPPLFPIQDNLPAAPGRVIASSPHFACTGRSQLGRMCSHTCSLTTGLSKGLLDAGIGLTQHISICTVIQWVTGSQCVAKRSDGNFGLPRGGPSRGRAYHRGRGANHPGPRGGGRSHRGRGRFHGKF
jgi:hypothetical protein